MRIGRQDWALVNAISVVIEIITGQSIEVVECEVGNGDFAGTIRIDGHEHLISVLSLNQGKAEILSVTFGGVSYRVLRLGNGEFGIETPGMTTPDGDACLMIGSSRSDRRLVRL